VKRTQWGLALNVIGVVIAGTGIAIDEGDGRILVSFIVLSLVFFIPGFILSPSRKERGDAGEVVTTLAAQGIGNAVSGFLGFVLVCVLLYKANDIYGWTREKAVDAYETGKEMLKSEEEKVAERIRQAHEEIGALPDKGATRSRFAIESALADDLAEEAESDLQLGAAIDAYGAAAITANQLDDLDALEAAIDRQIALDRKRGAN